MKHERTPGVICPHCDHKYTSDDMNAWGNDDLWGMAPNEEDAHIGCPSCGDWFFIKGSYRPEYTTAIFEDDL